ncbi:MAG: glycosyltransferase [Candidatus Sumerlaeota bacterium]
MKRPPSYRRVALVVPNLELGGAERQAVELAEELKRAGWYVIVIAAESHGPLAARLKKSGVGVYDLNTEFWRKKSTLGFWLNLLQSILALRRILRAERIAVAHSFLFWQNVILALAACGLRSVKAVITGRRSMGNYKDARSHYQPMENLANLLTSHIVCNSEEVKRDALRREKFIRGKISVIANGVDGGRFHGNRHSQTDPFNTLTVGTVGNLKREKRHDIFLRAFSQVAAQFFSTRALIAGGDHGQQSMLTNLASDLFISDRVEFMGAVEADSSLYHAFDIFVLTSDEEGMPNVLLEAMACGCAIVTTNVGGVSRLVKHEEHALIVPIRDANAVANAVIRLIESPEFRECLGRNAANRARSYFTTQVMARNYMKLYQKVVSRKRVR